MTSLIYDIRNLKHDTNELVCETETKLLRSDGWPRGRGQGRMEWRLRLADTSSYMWNG